MQRSDLYMARLVLDSAIHDFSLTNERFSKQYYFRGVVYKEIIASVTKLLTQTNLESLEYFKYNIIITILLHFRIK